jgi:hypothetical protein
MKRSLKMISVALAFSVVATAQSGNPFVGTWRVNLAKSTYSPGQPPKSSTTKIEAAGSGLRDTNDTIDASGKATHTEWTANFDGKDYPITGDPGRDAVSVRKIDDHTYEVLNKKSGKTVNTARIVVARDGKSRTVTTTGIDAQGRKINNVVVSEKE